MKRVLCVMGMAVLLLAATATAQSPLKFGIKVGPTMATLTGDGWESVEETQSATIEKKSLMGVSGGLFVELPFGMSGVSLQPELLYVTKGAKGEITDGGDTYTEKVQNTYIEVPVLIRYNFTSAGGASPFMFVGPVAAFKIASKVQFENPPADAEELNDKDIDNAKSLDFGVTIGAGLGLSVGPSGKLTFDLRYTLGLADVFEDAPDLADDAPKINMVDDDDKALDFKNSDIRLMAGFQF